MSNLTKQFNNEILTESNLVFLLLTLANIILTLKKMF